MKINEQIPNIILWILLWLCSWAVFFWFVHKKGKNYSTNFIWVSLYFLCVTLAACLIFKNYLPRALTGFTITPFVILAPVILAHIVLYLYLPKYIEQPKEYVEKYQFLKIDLRRLLSKSVDILSQQTLIVILIILLRDAGLNFNQIIIVFAVIFGLVHAPLIIIQKGAWPSWYFTAFSMLSAIVFPVLILKVQYGFVYSYMVHWVFFAFTAIGFTCLYNRWRRFREITN